MKIALCLSGQMRAMRYCIDSIHTAFPDCDIDVFATVWDYEDEDNINILKDKLNVIFLDRVSNNHLKKYSDFEVESLERGFENVEYVENWAPVPVWNLTRIELMSQNSFNATKVKNYDYIVRSRYDTRFLTNLLPMLDDSSILLSEDIGGSAPWDTWKGTRSVFDGFAVGSYYDMTQYYNFVDWLPNYFNYHQDTLKAERTMGWYLSNIAKLNCRYAKDILGIQINKDEWYNRSYPNQAKSLKSKQKGTFDFYKQDLQKNHLSTYNKIKHVFDEYTFSIRCTHRSGSNFLQQLIIQNSKTRLDCIQSDKDSNEWKHGEWYPSYLDGKIFTCVMARNPLKWVNSCVTFNADMWKWWDVNSDEQSELTFDYKDRIVSIPKMITKWNRFYKNWLNSTNSYFVWYTDTIEPQSRYNLLSDLSQSYKLRIDTDNIIVPSKVKHSENYSNTKIQQEFDLEYLPNLTAMQIEYIKDNVDKDLIKLMNERRQYESSSSIQW